jgi:hypothetical protein
MAEPQQFFSNTGAPPPEVGNEVGPDSKPLTDFQYVHIKLALSSGSEALHANDLARTPEL